MNAPFTPSTNLAKVRALYSGLTDSDVIAVLSDLIEGAMGTNISDDLLDAMTPLQIGLNEAWDRMEAVARPDVVGDYLSACERGRMGLCAGVEWEACHVG